MSRLLTLEGLLPKGYKYRELWLPQNIVGTTLPSSVKGGNPLTLTNQAAKRTTCDGVHFVNGSATSNIDCGAIHNSATKLWISLRFKLDQDHAASGTLQYLFGKYQGATDFLLLNMDNIAGGLRARLTIGGVEKFDVSSTQVAWTAGVWYHAILSISSAEGMRLIVDGGTPATDADTTAIPAAGDFCIGAWSDGSADSLNGVITDVVIGTDDLSAAEETDLYNGIPPADAVNLYTLDEGRGTTANDRGSGADNGTLDSSCTWAYSGVKQACLSCDGVNDYAQSASSVDMTSPLTMVWVAKLKSTYNSLSRNIGLFHLASGSQQLLFYSTAAHDGIQLLLIGTAGTQIAAYEVAPSIGDYVVLLGVVNADGTAYVYYNGVMVASIGAGFGLFTGTNASASLCRDQSGTYDPSSPLMGAVIDGGMTAQAALEYSKNIDNFLGLGVM